MMKKILDDETIYEKTASVIKKTIETTLLKKNIAVIGLPGGRSISMVLKFLKKYDIIWEQVHVFLVDERLVKTDDIDSNFRLIKQALSDVIPTINLHPFIFDAHKLNLSIKQYENEIKKYGGRYDIVVVSSGEDGHIASLFPNHPSIFNNDEYYILVENAPKPPKQRMSISKKFLLKSDTGVLLFIDETKKEAYKRFLDQKLSFTSCPAKLVSMLPRSFILTNIKI